MSGLGYSFRNGDWERLRQIIQQLASLRFGPESTPIFAGLTLTDSLALSYLTPGSVLFAGTGGTISQDNTGLFYDDANNRLGIGTSSPEAELHIEDSTGSVELLLQSLATSDATIRIRNGSSSKWTFGNDASNDEFIISTGSILGNPKLTILQGGKVGIGTGATAPNAPLEVKGAKPGVVGGHQSGQLQVTGTGGEFYCAVITGHNSYDSGSGPNTQLWYLGSTSSSTHDDIAFINRRNAAMHFSTNNATRMTIDAAGNVGIGLTTVDANYKLIVRRAADINLGVGLQETELAIAAFNDAISANIPMRFYASEFNLLNGKVGIGVIDPDTKLEIFDTGTQLKLSYDADNYTTFATGSDGDLTITTVDSDGAAGDITLAPDGDVKFSSGVFLVFDKASGNGIKVDTTTPTFGFADIIGDQFSKNTGATKPTLIAYNGAVDGWQFANGDEAFMSFHIPHDYVAGTDIHLHIHWSQNAAGATGGTVDFKYTAIYAKGHNQASGSTFTATPITATFSSIDINDGASGLNQYQQFLTEVTISAAAATAALFDRDDFEPDGVIELTFEMVTTNLTGTPSLPFVHFVDIHYQTTGLIGTKSRAPDFYA